MKILKVFKKCYEIALKSKVNQWPFFFNFEKTHIFEFFIYWKNYCLFVFTIKAIYSIFQKLSESVKIIKIVLFNFKIKPQKPKKLLHLTPIEMISQTWFNNLITYIFRQQLPVKFAILLRAAYLFPKTKGKNWCTADFYPTRAMNEFKNTAMCTNLIQMYLPCLSENQILL